MPFGTVDPAKTGLVFFDALNAYFHQSAEDEKNLAPVLANDVKLRDAADQFGIPVFFAKADHRRDGLDVARVYSDTNSMLKPWDNPETDRFEPQHVVAAGEWSGEVIGELKFSDSDTLIRKNRWSAFHDTKLALSLRTRGIDTIILAGGAIEIGIVSTAFQARDMDFGQVIVRDACTSLENDVGDMFMEHIFPRFARIRSTEETVEMMRAGHARGG
jgi:nicotinamidase-related amidase